MPILVAADTHRYRPNTGYHAKLWILTAIATAPNYYQLATGNQALINLQFLIVDIIRHFIYILMAEDRLPDG